MPIRISEVQLDVVQKSSSQILHSDLDLSLPFILLLPAQAWRVHQTKVHVQDDTSGILKGSRQGEVSQQIRELER
jgi:predicted hotdog family 3-hydroxylacyl-ACP dehydratase